MVRRPVRDWAVEAGLPRVQSLHVLDCHMLLVVNLDLCFRKRVPDYVEEHDADEFELEKERKENQGC